MLADRSRACEAGSVDRLSVGAFVASQIGAPELATIALAATGVGAAVLNYDYILEFIGVAGLLVTFASEFSPPFSSPSLSC